MARTVLWYGFYDFQFPRLHHRIYASRQQPVMKPHLAVAHHAPNQAPLQKRFPHLRQFRTDKAVIKILWHADKPSVYFGTKRGVFLLKLLPVPRRRTAHVEGYRLFLRDEAFLW